MSIPRQVRVSDLVVYHANKQLPEWHDRGFQPSLPAIVTKVWSSGAINLRVAADFPIVDNKVDLKVFLDHNAKDRDAWVWVFGATFGTGQDQCSWPE